MNIFQESELFQNLPEDDIPKILACLRGRTKTYDKAEFLLLPGTLTTHMGIILSGSVDVVEEDFWGNRTILNRMHQGDSFAEAYAICSVEPLIIGVVAAEPCEVLWLKVSHMLERCEANCVIHDTLIRNLMSMVAKKSIGLTKKISHTSQRSTRKKLISYLSAMAQKTGNSTFTIPFNRQQLADYLAVDRSALSGELSKMSQEGILSYKKNQFSLYQREPME